MLIHHLVVERLAQAGVSFHTNLLKLLGTAVVVAVFDFPKIAVEHSHLGLVGSSFARSFAGY